MPICEYQCTECGERFQARQAIGEDGSLLNCPKCHAGNPQKLISSFFAPRSSASEFSDISCPTCSSDVCGLPPLG